VTTAAHVVLMAYVLLH